jgi:hypothetical protein
VGARLARKGFDTGEFTPGPSSPLFDYLRSLTTTVERIAAGLFTLQALACAVNETFIRYCEGLGDADTVAIYRKFIQPDEQSHEQLGQQLLVRYALTPDRRGRAREVVAQVLTLAGTGRAKAAERLGVACLPGC